MTTNGLNRAVLIIADRLFPETMAIVVAVPAVAAAVKVTGLPLKPLAVAVTVYVPALFPTLRPIEACPLLLVVFVAAVNDCPVAPVGVDAIAKLTVTPDTGLPPASVTVTTSAFVILIPIIAV